MRTGSGQRGRSNQIIAGCAEKIQTFFLHRLAVGEDSAYRSASGFLGTSHGFVFQSGDAAFFVSRGRIFINGLIMTLEIILEIIDETYGFFKHFFICTAIHKQSFCTEHFRNFCENRSASLGNDERSRKLDKTRITALFFIDSIFLSSLSGVTI